MILLNILKYRNDSNFAHTFLSIIKSSHANPPKKIFFFIMLLSWYKYISKRGWGSGWWPSWYTPKYKISGSSNGVKSIKTKLVHSYFFTYTNPKKMFPNVVSPTSKPQLNFNLPEQVTTTQCSIFISQEELCTMIFKNLYDYIHT